MNHYWPERELNWNNFSRSCTRHGAESKRFAGSAPQLQGNMGSFVLDKNNTFLFIVRAAKD